MSEITIKDITDVEPFGGPQALPGIRFRAMREAMGVSSWGMNVLELDPDCADYPEHQHPDGHEEVYVVLDGAVVLQAGGEEYDLRQGQMVRVPGDVRRKLVTTSEGVTLLALGGTPNNPYAPSMGS